MTSKAFGLAQLGNAYADGALSNRNLIINGAMQVAQRGTSASSLSSGDAYSTVDRFMSRITTAGTWTQSQSADVPSGQGFATSLKMECTAANASLSATSDLQIQYRFEGQDLQQLAYGAASAKQVTLSFWVKATKTGTNIVRLYQDDGDDQTSKAYTVNTSDTWEYKTITFSGNTASAIVNDNTRGLILIWHLAAGSNKTSGVLSDTWDSYVEANEAVGQVNHADSTDNNWQITGVQLEAGDTATPFEHRSFGQELALCQRYCQVFTGAENVRVALSGNGGNTSFPTLVFVTEMRASPTGQISSPNHFYVEGLNGGKPTPSSVSLNVANKYAATFTCVASGITGNGTNLLFQGSDGKITLSAEL